MARLHVLTAAVLFGTTGTAHALGPELEPLAVGAARVIAGAALLTLIAAVTRRARLGRGSRYLILVSGLFVAAYQATFFAAVADTGVAVGTVVALGSAPAFTGLFARVFAGDRLARRWYAATALACAGVALLTLGDGGEVSAPGVALALAAGAGYAGYAVAGKRLLDDGGAPEGVMAAVFTTGAVVLAPVLLFVPAAPLLEPHGLALALYLGALPTALAYILFARGLERIGASETSTLTLAEPVTAMALGLAVLGERPTAGGLAGAALVLGGLALLALPIGPGGAGRVAAPWRRRRLRSKPPARRPPTPGLSTSPSASASHAARP